MRHGSKGHGRMSHGSKGRGGMGHGSMGHGSMGHGGTIVFILGSNCKKLQYGQHGVWCMHASICHL